MSEEDVDDVHRFLNGNENSLRMEDEGLFSIFFAKDEESKNARLHYSKRERLQHWIRINCSIPFFVTWICASILFVVGLCYFLFSEEYVYKLSGKCDVSRIPRSVTRLIIPDKKCNTRDLYSFKLREFEELKSIVIGNNCFVMTSLFRIEKLPKLVSIVVGDNSFDTIGEAKYFTVVHNPLLETIQIGKNSFSHFSEFQLSDCRSLATLSMNGENFLFSSLSLIGIVRTCLKDLHFGDQCFMYSIRTRFDNLPRLQNITLGKRTIIGGESDEWDLFLNDLPALESLSCKRQCFEEMSKIRIRNVPNLQYLSLPFSFSHDIQRIDIKNSPLFDAFDAFHYPRSEDIYFIPDDTEVFISKSFYSDSTNEVAFSNHPRMKRVYISYYSLTQVTKFIVESMPLLEEITIGEQCLKEAALIVQNCSQLRSIMISDSSFESSPSFILHGMLVNLPRLETLFFGMNSFINSSFIVEGLPRLRRIELDTNAFFHPKEVILNDLPSLEEVFIGDNSFMGNDSPDCLFRMNDLPVLTRFYSTVNSFIDTRIVEIHNVPSLKELRLPKAIIAPFQKVMKIDLYNSSLFKSVFKGSSLRFSLV